MKIHEVSGSSEILVEVKARALTASQITSKTGKPLNETSSHGRGGACPPPSQKVSRFPARASQIDILEEFLASSGLVICFVGRHKFKLGPYLE